jgi:hypothetical protein
MSEQQGQLHLSDGKKLAADKSLQDKRALFPSAQ